MDKGWMDGYKCWVLVCARCVLPFALGLTPMLVRAEWRRAFAHRSCPVVSFDSFSFGSFCFSCPRPGLKVARARIAQNALGLAKVSARFVFPVLGLALKWRAQEERKLPSVSLKFCFLCRPQCGSAPSVAPKFSRASARMWHARTRWRHAPAHEATSTHDGGTHAHEGGSTRTDSGDAHDAVKFLLSSGSWHASASARAHQRVPVLNFF